MVNLTYKNFNSFFLILLISFSNQGRIKRSELDSFSTGHFLLTNLLLDTLKKTASESKKEGRIINVSSDGHQYTYPEGILFDKINDESR